MDGSGAAVLGRSRSLKQVMEKDDWRMRSGGYGGDEQVSARHPDKTAGVE